MTYSGGGSGPRGRPLLLVLAVIMLLILGIGVGLLITGHEGSGSPAAASSSAVPAGSASPDESASPASWADDVTFYDIPGGLRLPQSRSAGPRVVTARGALASGFAHSPQGAVMAAVNIGWRTAGSLGEPIYQPTIQRQVVGDAKAALLATAQGEGRPDVPPPGERVQDSDSKVNGWDLVSYSADDAHVTYLISQVQDTGQPAYAAVPMEVRWVDGDWRLVAPASGDWAGNGVVPSDLSQFILFPGA